jgi:Dynamin GTPase effector domain
VAVTELLEKAAEGTRRQIKDYCLTETNRPFTLNSDYLPSKERFRTEFAIARNSDSGRDGKPRQESFQLVDTNGATRYFSTNDRTLFTVLAAFGVHISDITQLVRIHTDAYEPELDVGAHVMAYFDIASKRIIDDIPTLFETKFALNFAADLSKNLHPKLRLVGEDGFEVCKRYVCDEPSTQKKRDDLTRHIGILKEAEETVIRFHTSN